MVMVMMMRSRKQRGAEEWEEDERSCAEGVQRKQEPHLGCGEILSPPESCTTCNSEDASPSGLAVFV
eukprot:8474924-Pyramimonas_sp.AAC.1